MYICILKKPTLSNQKIVGNPIIFSSYLKISVLKINFQLIYCKWFCEIMKQTKESFLFCKFIFKQSLNC